MPTQLTFPEQYKVVIGAAPVVGAAAAITSDVISTKHLNKLWIVVVYNQADGNAITFTPMQATDVAAGTNKVLTAANTVPIWSNILGLTTDTLVERTKATAYAAGAVADSKLVIFQIDPSELDVANGYDCVYITSSAIAAAQYVAYLFIGEPRYAGPVAGQPSVIVD